MYQSNIRRFAVRVLVVDDSAFMRKMLREMIQSDPSLEVIDSARDGAEAVEKALKLKPDLITMDIEMPRMNGIEALGKILAQCETTPPAILMCSSLTVDGSVEALKALELGASDFIAKDPQAGGMQSLGFKTQLLSKLRSIGGHRRRVASGFIPMPMMTNTTRENQSHASDQVALNNQFVPDQVDAIVIGASTGGPAVLESILADLPESLPIPILVAQHMPKLFTESFANRLHGFCGCGAMLASHGTTLHVPKVYIAEGGSHLKLTRIAGKKIIARTIEHIDGLSYKPSVDLLFTSAAELFGPRVLAIQLTGMGEDGAIGANAIRSKGGAVIAQDSNSCVVYGMPRAVVENGSANAIMTPSEIKAVIQSVVITDQMGDSIQSENPRKSA